MRIGGFSNSRQCQQSADSGDSRPGYRNESYGKGIGGTTVPCSSGLVAPKRLPPPRSWGNSWLASRMGLRPGSGLSVVNGQPTTAALQAATGVNGLRILRWKRRELHDLRSSASPTCID
ncbi:hypothetical protein OPT61_g9173 [Boeremia exigua]|uniref:Uncharacterized protein n=1 Tax=Boeremia exigua TaxID=749465 RepID=A0ACC2HVJ5_9PLEO|nr:hypothetical protein OPT61_g9173 [Boeremia exigua]